MWAVFIEACPRKLLVFAATLLIFSGIGRVEISKVLC